MRNRTVNSTTPLDTVPLNTAPLDTADRWFITEKGLRASGAASMMATAASLHQAATELEQAASRLNQEAPSPPDGSGVAVPLDFRRITVCGRYHHQTRVPALRLSGLWLRNAGFELGQKVQVQVADGQLMICAE